MNEELDARLRSQYVTKCEMYSLTHIHHTLTLRVHAQLLKTQTESHTTSGCPRLFPWIWRCSITVANSKYIETFRGCRRADRRYAQSNGMQKATMGHGNQSTNPDSPEQVGMRTLEPAND
jgi:hypothetical protein